MGNRLFPDMKPLRVYFFCLESVFLDFVVSMANTTIGSFVKFVIECYKSKSSMNQQLLRFQDQPSRYKILPSIDDSEKERHIADTNIPELSDKMMMIDAIGENTAYCCFVEVEEGQYEFDSISHIEEGPDHDLYEFQNVYSKSGEIVFKVDFKEKEFSTIIRIGKEKVVGDLFDLIVKKKKIEIDKRSFFLQGKVFCSDSLSKLDYNLPLSMLDDQYLKICRRDYEDREGGTLDKEQLASPNQNNNQILLNNCSETQDDEDEDSNDQRQDEGDEEDQDEDNQEQLLIKGEEKLPRLRERKTAKKLELKYTPQQQIQLPAYEEFKVTKVTYVSNQVSKRSQRVIGIDENYIYNKKEQSNFFSLGFILSFFFPASPSDTKCPTKKILDIKDMYIIDGTSLLIQFYEKNFIKYWFLFNKDPSVSKRMLEKLTYLRKLSEIRIFS